MGVIDNNWGALYMNNASQDGRKTVDDKKVGLVHSQYFNVHPRAQVKYSLFEGTANYPKYEKN